jgi:hypothetical protein
MNTIRLFEGYDLHKITCEINDYAKSHKLNPINTSIATGDVYRNQVKKVVSVVFEITESIDINNIPSNSQ